MRRVILYSIFFLCIVAGFSITAPYSSLWSAFHQRHLEPSGQAVWQIRERKEQEERKLQEEEQARLAAETEVKRKEEERLAAEAQATREKEETQRRYAEFADLLSAIEKAGDSLASSIIELKSLHSRVAEIAAKGKPEGEQALAAMKNIESALEAYLATTLQEQEMSIAAVMNGDACGRSSGPVSAFDSPIDTVRYILLCAYEKRKNNAEILTRANLILFLNRSQDHSASNINGTTINLPELIRIAWLETHAEGGGSALTENNERTLRNLFDSKAPAFVEGSLIRSLTIAEHQIVTNDVLPQLREHQEFIGKRNSQCSYAKWQKNELAVAIQKAYDALNQRGEIGVGFHYLDVKEAGDRAYLKLDRDALETICKND